MSLEKNEAQKILAQIANISTQQEAAFSRERTVSMAMQRAARHKIRSDQFVALADFLKNSSPPEDVEELLWSLVCHARLDV